MDASERRQRAAVEATEWLLVLQGEASQAQRERYIDWLRESPLHVAEMLRVARVHGALEQFSRWTRIPTDGLDDDDDRVVAWVGGRGGSESEREREAHSFRAPRWAWPLAAMVVVAVVALAANFPHWRGQVIQTDRAERREVALADGSVVQVDPETRLRVKYEERARYVFLERGRALFHVAKDKDRPFLVRARDTTVRAVGTAFAVEQQSHSVLVTVAEGKVEVTAPITSSPPDSTAESSASSVTSSGGASIDSERQPPAAQRHGTTANELKSSGAANGSANRLFLVANQQVTVDRSGSAEAVRTVDSGRALAWAEGRLVFEYLSLGDAVRQFNKYNSIQLMVNDSALAERPISGVFNASDPESFVAFLQSVAPVRITRTRSSDIVIDRIK